jgi:hypothetical protein
MKKIGLILITISFLIGALATMIETDLVEWKPNDIVRWDYFTLAIVIGVAGVFLAHTGHKKIQTSQDVLDKNISSVETSLANIVKKITELNSQKENINTYDVRLKIDELFPNDLTNFVDARKSISHIFGLVAYGEVMSSFAAGERYLNRVWSASADGYIDEVNTYIEKSREQFTESLDKLHSLKKVQPS